MVLMPRLQVVVQQRASEKSAIPQVECKIIALVPHDSSRYFAIGLSTSYWYIPQHAISLKLQQFARWHTHTTACKRDISLCYLFH